MTTLSQVMPSDSGEIERTLTGISAASSAFGRHSGQFDQLLEMSRRLSEMAVAQQDLVVETAVDARTLVQTMAVRKEALTGLANNLRAVITTLSQTFTENREEADRLVANLTAVTATLQRNSENLASLMTQLPPALRTVPDATGNGTWDDVTTPAAVLPDNLLCAIGVMQECR